MPIILYIQCAICGNDIKGDVLVRGAEKDAICIDCAYERLREQTLNEVLDILYSNNVSSYVYNKIVRLKIR